ncbi:zinc-dependent alcohol dehydrogenase family protein [Meiothermus sp. QL-1]|uniref:zinc-dependent alcohol dehydrogenase family protein n=1 Tax=Meiothermus sp. QL-1 TaxID=2058095 RepID=UPI001F2E3B27|nr:zinc-dependent alcohol dehydrogenase family protein [Meiothermus sp. QL-1]
MRLEKVGEPLHLREVERPEPTGKQLLLRVRACGVCRTDLHIFEGELPHPKLPLVLGHEIVGEVVAVGPEARRFRVGERVGVPWLGATCGACRYCRGGQENLCDKALFTGYTLDGGYAEYALAQEDYCFAIPAGYSDLEAAPLLCAGLIGYRAYRLAGEGVERIGLYGFGAAAHLIAQVAVHQGREVYAFTRPGDTQAQALARRLGAVWAGGSDQLPPEPLDAALIFAPVGALVPQALRATRRGGVVVCAGIHMSDIPAFPYALLWEERSVRSVANLTRQDGEEFLALARAAGVRPQTMPFALEEANQALRALKEGRVHGAAVLLP